MDKDLFKELATTTNPEKNHLIKFVSKVEKVIFNIIENLDFNEDIRLSTSNAVIEKLEKNCIIVLR